MVNLIFYLDTSLVFLVFHVMSLLIWSNSTGHIKLHRLVR